VTSPSLIHAGFEKVYSLEVLQRAPLIQPSRTFVFPHRVEEIERGALHVLVRPAHDEPWLGIFALGYASPHVVTGVWSTPNPQHFLAASGGYAYLANTAEPEHTRFLTQQPIVWIGACADPALLLLADHRTITAVAADGLAWQSEPLSMEGLTDLRVEADTLQGNGWDAITDRETPWTLRLFADRYERL
jgi:hypothetical protein